MEQPRILWIDDEIDLLKPHVLFLQEKGHEVETVTNGKDAVDAVKDRFFDLILLDENMPGLSGMETLGEMREVQPNTPVVMITKSEEEQVMEDAIGSRVSDYLIKPVNPNQILLSIKKNLENKRLVSEKTTTEYQREFRDLGMRIDEGLSTEAWKELYRRLVYWDIELERSEDEGMLDVMRMQRSEANSMFSRKVAKEYVDWLHGKGEDLPLLSHRLLQQKVLPLLEDADDSPIFLVVIDNLRYDQWKALEPRLSEYFRVQEDDLYYSILPTATHFSRNALFAGMMPSEIERRHPELWKNEGEKGSKNQSEAELLDALLERLKPGTKASYHKILDLEAGRKLADRFQELMENDLNVIVHNFVDILSHARTDTEVIRELAEDEPAYRSLTLSWFDHSPLLDILRNISENGGRVVLTSDHGSIRVQDPVKVKGDRNTTTNLRYKQGKNLDYNPKEVFEIREPEKVFLPRLHMSSRYIFALEDHYFVYPNNYHYYVNYYKDTFQHGGISLEEVLVPVIDMKAK
ncbi:MAG: PglZ domain-containing protein [Flavobacteriales bacterium]